MSNSEIATANGGLPANINQMAAALAQSAQTAGASAGGELYMKFAKGEWTYGAEETEADPDGEWAINPNSFQHGFVCWGVQGSPKEGTNLGERMVSAMEPLPAKGALPDIEDGEWSTCVGFQMRCTSGDDEGVQVLFKTSSHGGRKAYAAVLQAVISQLQKDASEPVALVKLGADSYKHAKYGKIWNPVLDVVGWASMHVQEAAEAAATGDADEDEDGAQDDPPPAKEPEPEAPRRRRRRSAA